MQSLAHHQVATSGGAAIVLVSGELDLSSSADLLTWLYRAVDDHPSIPVQVDLGSVSFIDYSSITALVAASDHARQRGTSLRVVNPRPFTVRLLAVMGVLDALMPPPET